MKTKTVQKLRLVPPSLASEFIDSGERTLIQFSTKSCAVCEVFEPFLVAFDEANKNIDVFKVDLEKSIHSEHLPFTMDFLFSPSYAAFEGGILLGYTNTASSDAFDALFDTEESNLNG